MYVCVCVCVCFYVDEASGHTVAVCWVVVSRISFKTAHSIYAFCSYPTGATIQLGRILVLFYQIWFQYDQQERDSTDDLALLASTPAQAKFFLHSPEQTANSIGVCVNVDKTKFMCFQQRETISNLNGKPLELVNQFTYLSSDISSTESNVILRISKECTGFVTLSTIWESKHSDKIK